MAATAKTDPTVGAVTPEPRQTRQKPRRWRWYLTACLLLLAFLPTMVCQSTLRNLALAAALRAASIRGQATAATLSVGWLSPLALTDFELRDPDGELLARVPKLTIDKSLVGLLFRRNEPGPIRLAGPMISVRLKDGGSNVEDAFADLIEHAQRHAGMPLELELTDATVMLDDLAAQREWKFEQVAFQLSRPEANGRTQFTFTALSPQTSDKSQIKFQGDLPPRGGNKVIAGSTLDLDVADFPLQALRALVARVRPGTEIAGELSGHFDLTQAADGAGAGSLVGDVSIADLLLAGPQLGDDVLKLARVEMPCEMALKDGAVTVRKLDVRSDVGQLASSGNLRFSGEEPTPPVGPLTPALESASGEVSGSLDLARLARLLPHRIRMRPGDQVATAPVAFHVAPRLRRENTWILELGAGRVLDHVQASPELCDAWLKFALPVLAEVTQVGGEFSVDLEGFQLPLDRPASGQTAGSIAVHHIELGPGPLVRQFLPAIEKLRGMTGSDEPRPERLSIARESQVEFRLVDGRVYHRGLRLQFPSFTLETYGSVGLDESLAMMAEISLPQNWLGDGPLATLLKSRSLQLPIGGTLKKPTVDLNQLRGLGRQTVRETAKEVLGEELQRGLNRLFKKEPK